MSPIEVDDTQGLEKPAEEVKETPEADDKIVVKDGEVFIREPIVPEGPEAESTEVSEEKPVEDKPAATEVIEEKPAQSGKEQAQYTGKSVEDLHKMLDDRNATISRQGSELGDYRKTEKVREENLTDEQKLERMGAETYAQVVNREKDKLRSIDSELDADDYTKQAALIDDMQTVLNTKVNKELIRKEVNQSENTRLITEQKLIFISNGIELNDSEFEQVSEVAVNNFSIDGRVTDASFDHALLQVFGAEKYRTFLLASGGLKARKEMAVAEVKVSPTVDVESAGAGTKLTNIKDLSGKKLDAVLKTLSNEQIDELLKQAGL